MNDQITRRRKLIAVLIVVLPLLTGLAIAAVAYLLGGDEVEIRAPRPSSRPQLVEAATPRAPGTRAPRVRLLDGGSGGRFDGASLDGEPYAVVFISTRCEAIAGFLRRAAADLRTGEAAVLAISADPAVDSPAAVRRWLADNRLAPGGPFHFLIGDARALRRYWSAWGFVGPAARCPGSVPVHLVSGAGRNTGILDAAPDSPASFLTEALRRMPG